MLRKGCKSLLKDLLYASIGFASLTKEKAEDAIAELIKKGELSTEEGKNVLNDMVNKMQVEKSKLKEKIDEQIETAINSMNLVKKSDLDSLITKVTELEMKINELEDEKEA